MFSPKDKQDKLIRATDLDALSCRDSINKKGHLPVEDPYIAMLVKSYEDNLRWCQGYTGLSAPRTLRNVFGETKQPLINRGTYLRSKVIFEIIHSFIAEFRNESQIISLGSGSDTKLFSILESNHDITVHEYDYPESAKIKKLAILKHDKLRHTLRVEEGEDQTATMPTIQSKKDFEIYEPDLHTRNYHLHGQDLRDVNNLDITGVDTNKPTLVLSECALCYLSAHDYERVVNFWSTIGHNLTGFLIYEPITLGDSFGEVMSRNLQGRGLHLPTSEAYPTIDSRIKFLTSMGLENLYLTDMGVVGGYEATHAAKNNPWISELEMERLNGIERIDEHEELALLLRHYCLIYGESKKENQSLSFNSSSGLNPSSNTASGSNAHLKPVFTRISRWDWSRNVKDCSLD
ncbi:carboxy methyl transferase for protein phosphatase 2A [Lodderomyces elongisporus]|uniref:carboxy methyl transferase for protein phosphatase 2A n=1 Tax=Lodderomyces elongisporus TaxID=36914 RepID=UPI002921A0D4|nr:carboxy methyl transferase for protein phosphatase 2A [Lodderomyces elongisporus]WLF78830.1 carboxy methyl transferase for protein phosphatase 2A [Lodderomyces elongisporus]